MLLDGQTQDTYGQLNHCGDDDNVFQEIYEGRGVLPGVGILILAIQVGPPKSYSFPQEGLWQTARRQCDS